MGVSCCFLLRDRRRLKTTIAAKMERAARPPMVPPTIAPISDFLGGTGVAVAVGDVVEGVPFALVSGRVVGVA